MYCGDETGSFIGDVGSHSCRFGYGGEDNPKMVVSSYVSNKQHLAPSALSPRLAEQELESILRTPTFTSEEPIVDPTQFLVQGDSVQSWDALEVAWKSSMEALRATDTLKHTLGGTPCSTTVKSTNTAGDGKCVHPILAITPGFTHFAGYGANYCAAVNREQYVKTTELLMESIQASAVFLAPSSMLSAFSLGRQTALVVDIGAGGCRVTPIVDGLVLEQAQRRNGRGGDWLNHVSWKALLQQKLTPTPRYLLRKQVHAKSPLFHQWAMQELMYELRTAPHVTLDFWSQDARVPFTPVPSDDSSSESPPSTPTADPLTYQLPDGTSIDLSTPTGKDFCRIPELLFTDDVPFGSTAPPSNLPTLSDLPLHRLIQQSLLAVADVDVRKDLAGCICLVGGASVVPNLEARLSAELTALLPTMVKPKVTASRNTVERSCAAWIGASVLTSLGSFQQLWLSRTEYEEYGTTLGIQRFP
jgi:actin-like protein 6A